MHLRHKSIPGLLLNQALVSELSHHCAFCHYQIAARSIHKHYTDQYPQLIAFATQYQAHVLSLANIGSGRGRCSFCDKECRNVRSHECGVLFQLAAMLGHTFQPEFFPVMPVMMKASKYDNMFLQTRYSPRQVIFTIFLTANIRVHSRQSEMHRQLRFHPCQNPPSLCASTVIVAS